MVVYRAFRNTDPPRLFALWKGSGLGRGAAQPQSVMAFEVAAYSLPYFDSQGLIVADADGQVVGYVHAGFGFLPDERAQDRNQGVICVVVVHPAWRRQGIGRELVRRAEEYLRSNGATAIQFGQTRLSDPFYLGIHGGARPSGVLESDPYMGPFLTACGYNQSSSATVLQRDLTTNRDPTNFRLIGLRRQTELLVTEHEAPATFAWYCHYGNMESMRFSLTLKKTGRQIAAITVIGLDHYIRNWGERAIGLVDLHVEEQYRGQGYGTTLLIEALRRLRSEMNITLAELHVEDTHATAQKAVRNAGFIPVEKAVVYKLA